MGSKVTRSNPAKAEKPSSSTKSGSLRSSLKQFTRERMLNAALQCFRERGYQETTVEKIAELAGTTVPTFYRHFPSKSDLLHPLLDHLTVEVETTLQDLNSRDVSNRREVRQWLDSYMVMWGRVHKLCAAHWEAVNVDPIYAERVLGDGMNCATILRSVMDKLDAAAKDQFAIRFALMLTFLDRMAVMVAAEKSASRARQIMDEMSGMLWAVLNHDPALGS